MTFSRRIFAAAAVAWGSLAALLAVRFSGRATDDIYVTYRYAWNLAHGFGFVFNPGEPVFGLTDPGTGLLFAAVHRLIGLPVPIAGTVLSALALWGIALLILADAGDRGRLPEGLAAGTLIVGSGYLWTAQGSGPLFALVLLLLAGRVAGTLYPGPELGRPRGGSFVCAPAALPVAGAGPTEPGPAWRLMVVSGVLAGLAFWCRPDAALGIATLGLLLLWEGRRLPWAWAMSALGVMSAGCALAYGAFGTLIPNTLAAKRAYAAFEPGERLGLAFWRAAWDLWRRFEGRTAILLLAVGLAGVLVLVRSGGWVGRLLGCYGIAIALAYSVLRVPFFIWYTVPPAVAVLAGAPWAMGALVRALAARERRGWALALGAAGGLVFAAVLWAGGRWVEEGGKGDWRLAAYSRAGEWLATHSVPGDDVALEEIGIVGYGSRLPVSDLMGLITPRAVPYAAQGDLIGAFLAHPTRFLIFHTFTFRGGTRPIVSRPWFAAAYEEAVRFDLPAQGGAITVYRRRPDARIPPPRPPHAHRS